MWQVIVITIALTWVILWFYYGVKIAAIKGDLMEALAIIESYLAEKGHQPDVISPPHKEN